MAYLDRPSPAGYFIFPDLSVRHEGKYRLSFNLYEEQKDPKDADADSGPGGQEAVGVQPARNGTNASAPQNHCHFRLEVKSEPFTVYSAKKFPGLKESTTISRVVSEQGCRVRIRRDVRMRRRDTKPSGAYDGYEDESVYARSDRFITPEGYNKPQIPDRPRSIGNGLNDVAPSYSVEAHRPPMADVSYYGASNFPLHQSVAQPPTVNSGVGSHLAFGNSPTSNFLPTNFHPPINQPPASLPSANDYHPYPTAARGAHYSNLPSGAYPQPLQHSSLIQTPTSQASGHANLISSTPIYADSNGYHPNTEYRQPAVSSTNPAYAARALDPYPSVESHHPGPSVYYPPVTSNPGPMTPTEHALPPLRSLETNFDKKYDPNAAISIKGGMITPSPSYTGLETPRLPSHEYNSARTGKRKHDTVFDTSHISEPLHGGMRPDPSQNLPQIEAEENCFEEMDPRVKMLAYRRADGSKQWRKCPSPVSE